MSHWNNMITSHGWMNGWVAEPDDKPNGGVVLVPDIFGVNEDMRSISERYAIAGYLTVVPALFDKLERDVEMGYDAESTRRGNELARELGTEVAVELVATAADAIAHAGKVALIGYGWGGKVALHAAQSLSLHCVSYFGQFEDLPGEGSILPRSLLHYAGEDNVLPEDLVAEYRKRSPAIEIYSYLGSRAFDRPGDTASHNAEHARLAYLRTQDFLSTAIRQER
jgi:carboxymethylenebutenolidase